MKLAYIINHESKTYYVSSLPKQDRDYGLHEDLDKAILLTNEQAQQFLIEQQRFEINAHVVEREHAYEGSNFYAWRAKYVSGDYESLRKDCWSNIIKANLRLFKGFRPEVLKEYNAVKDGMGIMFDNVIYFNPFDHITAFCSKASDTTDGDPDNHLECCEFCPIKITLGYDCERVIDNKISLYDQLPQLGNPEPMIEVLEKISGIEFYEKKREISQKEREAQQDYAREFSKDE